MPTTDDLRITAYTRYTKDKDWKPCWATAEVFLIYPLDDDYQPSSKYEERVRAYAFRAAALIQTQEDHVTLAIYTLMQGITDCLHMAVEHNETRYIERFRGLADAANREVSDMRAKAKDATPGPST